MNFWICILSFKGFEAPNIFCMLNLLSLDNFSSGPAKCNGLRGLENRAAVVSTLTQEAFSGRSRRDMFCYSYVPTNVAVNLWQNIMNRDNSINHMQPQHHLQLYPFVYYSFSCTWSHRISQTVMVTSPAPCMALQEKELGFDATSGEPGIGGGWGRVHDQAILWSHRQDGIRKITVSCVSTGFCTKLSSSIFWTLRSQWSEILALQSFFFSQDVWWWMCWVYYQAQPSGGDWSLGGMTMVD